MLATYLPLTLQISNAIAAVSAPIISTLIRVTMRLRPKHQWQQRCRQLGQSLNFALCTGLPTLWGSIYTRAVLPVQLEPMDLQDTSLTYRAI